jgi:hypothetical protein
MPRIRGCSGRPTDDGRWTTWRPRSAASSQSSAGANVHLPGPGDGGRPARPLSSRCLVGGDTGPINSFRPPPHGGRRSNARPARSTHCYLRCPPESECPNEANVSMTRVSTGADHHGVDRGRTTRTRSPWDGAADRPAEDSGRSRCLTWGAPVRTTLAPMKADGGHS